MNFKKIFFLVSLLTALLVYIYFFELAGSLDQTGPQRLFSGLQEREIRTIEIINPAGRFTLINRNSGINLESSAAADSAENSSWQLASLPAAALNREAVTSLLSAIFRFNPQEAFLPENTELQEFGFARQKFQLNLMSSGQQISVLFGAQSNYLKKRYVRISGFREVFLADDVLFDAVSKKQADYRERFPVKFDEELVRRIKLLGKEGLVFQLFRDAYGQWHISHPVHWPAEADRVKSLIDKLRQMRIEDFIEDQKDLPAEADADWNKDYSIELDFETKMVSSSLMVHCFDRGQDGFFIAVNRNPRRYRISAASQPEITEDFEIFRERSLFKFQPGQVELLQLEYRGRQSIEASPSAGGWRVNGKTGDPVFIRQLLNNLAALRADSFPGQPQRANWADPLLKVKLRLSPQEQPSRELVLIVGDQVESENQEKAAYWVQTGEYIFAISASALKRISPREEVLLAARQLETPG